MLSFGSTGVEERAGCGKQGSLLGSRVPAARRALPRALWARDRLVWLRIDLIGCASAAEVRGCPSLQASLWSACLTALDTVCQPDYKTAHRAFPSIIPSVIISPSLPVPSLSLFPFRFTMVSRALFPLALVALLVMASSVEALKKGDGTAYSGKHACRPRCTASCRSVRRRARAHRSTC